MRLHDVTDPSCTRHTGVTVQTTDQTLFYRAMHFQIVRDTGLTAADAWALADDRSTWRALRPTAGYAQQ